MCEALRKLMKDDIDEAVAVAVEEERARALAEGQEKGTDNAFFSSIVNLMDTMKLTAEQAMDAIKIPSADRGKYRARL